MHGCYDNPSYRDKAGRPRQRILASWNSYDGSTITNAITECEAALSGLHAEAKSWRQWIAQCVPHKYRPPCAHYPHHSICERRAAEVERRVVREEARLLALRKVEQAPVPSP